MTQPEPVPEPAPAVEAVTENKSGGYVPTRVTTRPSPRKKGLLDRIEGWLSR